MFNSKSLLTNRLMSLKTFVEGNSIFFSICFALTWSSSMWEWDRILFSTLKLHFSCPIITMHCLVRDHYPHLLCTHNILQTIHLKPVANMAPTYNRLQIYMLWTLKMITVSRNTFIKTLFIVKYVNFSIHERWTDPA